MLKAAERWVGGWQRAIDAAKRHGVQDYRLEIDSPATRKEVDEVECAIARTLPELFRQTLLEFSRRVDFFWFLPEHVRPPKPLAGVFCGECSWDLGRIAAMYDQARWLASNAFVEDTPDERLWQDKLPFHNIGNGDFIAIDVSSSEPQPIVYLSHELAFSHGYVLGADFIDFMDRWTVIGCPDDDIWPLFFPERVKCIDLDHPNVALWCDWFGISLPNRWQAGGR
jgi:SMI1 / KNR4 family (SUKH-1)